MKSQFIQILKAELNRIDNAKTAKRFEKIITAFHHSKDAPKAIINEKKYILFNSNDYLGLRFHKKLRIGEDKASHQFGTGPGSVRFISGTLAVSRELEHTLALFHNTDDAMVFSSAFAANIAVISCFIKGQSKDSLISGNTLVLSDSLNHRSIIEGVRVANLVKEQRLIYQHLDYLELASLLENNKGKFKRVVVITDGIFSMLGEYADLSKINNVIEKYQNDYEEGIILIVDDSHGVGVFGKTGRGCEEVSNSHADILVGTLGKAFGADGGYVTGSKVTIDYLRESAATYIYSNSISPGTAGAALAALNLVMSSQGQKLLQQSQKNREYFKTQVLRAGFKLAVDSQHPIQPILIGDPAITKALSEKLFACGILVSSINYPVVPFGRDEIRVQISAIHTKHDIDYFINSLIKTGQDLKLIK